MNRQCAVSDKICTDPECYHGCIKMVPRLTPVTREVPYLDTYGQQVMKDEAGAFYFRQVNGDYRKQD